MSATKGNMVPTPGLKAVATGVIRFGRLDVKVFILNDGARVIEEDSMLAALDAFETATPSEVVEFQQAFARFCDGSDEAIECYRREVMN